MKSMEYIIVEFADRQLFTERVNSRLQDGWMFHGTTLVNVIPNVGKVYTQAFVRELEPDSAAAK